MTHDEQVDHLKRELADLRDRVRRLEESPYRNVPGLGAPVFLPAPVPQPAGYPAMTPVTTTVCATGAPPIGGVPVGRGPYA